MNKIYLASRHTHGRACVCFVWRGQEHQGNFSLVKGTQWGSYKFLLEHFKGTKAMTIIASLKCQACIVLPLYNQIYIVIMLPQNCLASWRHWLLALFPCGFMHDFTLHIAWLNTPFQLNYFDVLPLQRTSVNPEKPPSQATRGSSRDKGYQN